MTLTIILISLSAHSKDDSCQIEGLSEVMNKILKSRTGDLNPVQRTVREYDSYARKWVDRPITFKQEITELKREIALKNKSAPISLHRFLAHQTRLRGDYNIKKGNFVEASKDYRESLEAFTEVVRGRKINEKFDMMNDKDLFDAVEAFSNAGDLKKLNDLVDAKHAVQTARDMEGLKPINFSKLKKPEEIFSWYYRSYNVTRAQVELLKKGFPGPGELERAKRTLEELRRGLDASIGNLK